MSYFIQSRLVKLVRRVTAKPCEFDKPEAQAKVKNSFNPIGPSLTSLDSQTGRRNNLDTHALRLRFRLVSPVPADSDEKSGAPVQRCRIMCPASRSGSSDEPRKSVDSKQPRDLSDPAPVTS